MHRYKSKLDVILLKKEFAELSGNPQKYELTKAPRFAASEAEQTGAVLLNCGGCKNPFGNQKEKFAGSPNLWFQIRDFRSPHDLIDLVRESAR
jgi:hypothetical protein